MRRNSRGDRGDHGLPGEEAPVLPVSEVFRRALGPVRAVLDEYRVAPETAAAVETDLAAWLLRYARRNPDASDEAKVLALVALACSFGRGYQARSGGAADRRMAALLGENPDAVAARVAAAFGFGAATTRSSLDLWTRVRALARLKPARQPDDPREE
ncbi:MAG: hypothetical protein ABI682_09090 [Acidobacteriota bacterium]